MSAYTNLTMTTHATRGVPTVGPPFGSGHDQPIDVIKWRLLRLCENGFPVDLAEELAMEPAVDLHALLALTDRGCPPRSRSAHHVPARSARRPVLPGAALSCVQRPRLPLP